jgi:hypothetical protein
VTLVSFDSVAALGVLTETGVVAVVGEDDIAGVLVDWLRDVEAVSVTLSSVPLTVL